MNERLRSADRQIKGSVTAEGVFLEQMKTNPAEYLPDVDQEALGGEVIHVDLNRLMPEIRAQISQYPIKTRLKLTGRMIVARDIAHARI